MKTTTGRETKATRGLRALAAAVLAASAGLSACSDSGSQEFLSIGTGGTGGIYYPLGGALAARLSVADTLRQYTAEVSGGSVENVNRLREGQIDLAFATGNTVYEAAVGGQDYEQPVQGLRVVAPLYPNMAHVVVSRGSEASSIEDFAGGTVSVGAPGSGTEQMARQILEVHGLDYEDVTPRYLSFNESATALRDGALDAAVISVGYPAAAILEATTTGGARLLPIAPDKVEALRQRYPYYTLGAIPQGAYPGMEADVVTAGIPAWIVGRSDLPDDVAALVVGVLAQQGASALDQVHEMASQIDMEFLRDAPVELHPATREWAEANLETARNP